MSQAGNNNQCIVASSVALYTFNVAAGDEATVVNIKGSGQGLYYARTAAHTLQDVS